jgi:hypothetical protein
MLEVVVSEASSIKLIAFKPKQVSGSWPSPDVAHFWRHTLRPAIRSGEAVCSLCARPLERRGDDPVVQVILCAPSESSRSVSAVVTICSHCGDDEWNCFRPQALETVLGAAALELDGGETRH